LKTEGGPQTDGAHRQDLLDVVLLLYRRWKWIAATMAVLLCAGVAASYLAIKPSYTSVAAILPPPSPQSLTATLLGKLSSEKPSKMAADTCVGILNSQTIEDRIIDDFHLQSIWKLKTLADTRTALRSEVQIEATDYDSVQIIVRDHDARRASDLANAYVSELNAVDAALAMTEAAHRGAILDREVKLDKGALQQAEDRLKVTQRQTGMISPVRQADQAIQDVQRIHAEINSRTVALQSMRSYATNANPQVIGLKAEIAGLESQLNRLQNDSRPRAAGDIQIPASQLAETALRYQRALRDVTQDDVSSNVLVTQLEAARMDRARSAPLVPIIDWATVADEKSGPQRMYLWAASCWVGFTAACLCIFLKQAMVQSDWNPEAWSKLRADDARPRRPAPSPPGPKETGVQARSETAIVTTGRSSPLQDHGS